MKIVLSTEIRGMKKTNGVIHMASAARRVEKSQAYFTGECFIFVVDNILG